MNTETAEDFESTTVLNFSDAEGAHQFLTLNLSGTVLAPLQAGDSDQDLDFDQLDLLPVLLANKYLTGIYPRTILEVKTGYQTRRPLSI